MRSSTSIFRLFFLCLMLQAFCVRPVLGAEADGFRINTITPAVRARIVGHSYPKEAEARVPMRDLRYLTLLYVDAEGQTHQGEMIVHKSIARDVVDIFRELYAMRFPIERMELMDNYDCQDEQSMRANNTSAFCFRTVKGSAKLSAHARGMAVDINPLYNPCFRLDANGRMRPGTLQPTTAAPYANRSKVTSPYKISTKVVELFARHGFRWGGYWRTVKDYQHFEKK